MLTTRHEGELGGKGPPGSDTMWQMTRMAAVLLGAGMACALAGAASSASDRAGAPSYTCLATPVRGDLVHAGPFAGGIDPDYDVANGRFRLHVGAWRDRSIGLSQKIPWFLPGKYRVGVYLVISGRRLAPAGGSFTLRLPEAGSLDPSEHVFPSNLSPPKAGCWRLSFQTRLVQGRLTVRVDR
jgi:hypothetical protein